MRIRFHRFTVEVITDAEHDQVETALRRALDDADRFTYSIPGSSEYTVENRCSAGGTLGPVFDAQRDDRGYFGGVIACTKCRAHFTRERHERTTGVERIPEHSETKDVSDV